jgi:hypothetical protein
MAMEADVRNGVHDRLILLEPVPDGIDANVTAEGLLRRLAQQGDVEAREAVAFLRAHRALGVQGL